MSWPEFFNLSIFMKTLQQTDVLQKSIYQTCHIYYYKLINLIMASRKRPSTRLHTMPTVERAVRVSCKWKTKPFLFLCQGRAHQSINSVIIIDHFSRNISQYFLVVIPQFLIVHKATATCCDLEYKQRQHTQCKSSTIGSSITKE